MQILVLLGMYFDAICHQPEIFIQIGSGILWYAYGIYAYGMY